MHALTDILTQNNTCMVGLCKFSTFPPIFLNSMTPCIVLHLKVFLSFIPNSLILTETTLQYLVSSHYVELGQSGQVGWSSSSFGTPSVGSTPHIENHWVKTCRQQHIFSETLHHNPLPNYWMSLSTFSSEYV